MEELSGGGGTGREGRAIHVFAFHRDDPLMLSDWAQYHGHVVGLTHVHVVDHASADVEARTLLHALAGICGLHLYRFSGVFAQTPKGQGGKAAALTAVMRRVAQSEVAAGRGESLLVPLDTDEFLVALDADGTMRAGQEAVHDAVERMGEAPPGRAGCWKLGMLTGLCPEERAVPTSRVDSAEDGRVALGTEFSRAMFFTPNTTRLMSKSFFSASHFAQVDQGNHACVTHGMSCRWDVLRASADPRRAGKGVGAAGDTMPKWCEEGDVGFDSGLALAHHTVEPSFRSLAHKIAGMAAAYDFARLGGADKATAYRGPGSDYLPVWMRIRADPADGARTSYRDSCALMRRAGRTSTEDSLAALLRTRAAPLDALLQRLRKSHGRACCSCSNSFPVAALSAPHDAVGRALPARDNPAAGSVCESKCSLQCHA